MEVVGEGPGLFRTSQIRAAALHRGFDHDRAGNLTVEWCRDPVATRVPAQVAEVQVPSNTTPCTFTPRRPATPTA